MSEYQYYEFLAIDRPLGEADRLELRGLSSRARITATSFSNHYEWGDFKGSPRRLMERWFDLHIYVSNWGTRQLMIRLPEPLVERKRLEAWLAGTDLAEILDAGDNLILDICDTNENASERDWDDGSGWIGAMAPLRMDLLSGDWRFLYLLWLMGVENGSVLDETLEPLPGIAPLNGGLGAFADFFRIDADLLQAAAEAPDRSMNQEWSAMRLRRVITALPESQKTALLLRLAEGDPHVATELRSQTLGAPSPRDSPESPRLRSACALRDRAKAIGREREAAAIERRRTEREQRERREAEARRVRLAALRGREADVWREVEAEIGRRNASAYDRAASLVSDLRAIAQEDGAMVEFSGRLKALHKRHERKQRFLERLHGLT